MLKARAVVENLKEYHPPLGRREGLRLDFNENVGGCSPRVLGVLASISTEVLNKYPEREVGELAVAEYLGVPIERLLLTNGVDEAIHLLCETYLEPGDEALIVVPTFSLYEIYALATGAKVVNVQAGEDFAFPTRKVLRAITPATKLIMLATPNNPTGAVAAREDLLAIAAAAPHAAMLVDEAYWDFHGETLLDQVGDVPNLFVARTFSKAFGLAGFRVGVLIGDEAQMKMVRRVGSPYNVNGVALACLTEALTDREFISGYVSQVREGRARAVLRRTQHSFLAESREFRARLFRRISQAAGRRDATPRYPGARPQQRSGLCRMRAHHRWHTPADGAAAARVE